MRNYKAVRAIVRKNFAEWKKDERIWVLAATELAVLTAYLFRLPGYLLKNDGTFTPFWLSFLFSEGINGNGNIKILIFLGSVFLFSDVPYGKYGEKQYVVFRTGRRGWWMGECLYIFLAAFCYISFITLLSMLFAFPGIFRVESWGTVPALLAQDRALGHSVLPGIAISAGQMAQLSPHAAFLYTFFSAWLSFALAGLITYCSGLLTGNNAAGIAVCIFLVLLDPVLNSMMNANITFLYCFSPVNWSSVDLLMGISGYGVLNPWHVFFALIVLCAAFVLVIAWKTGSSDMIRE